MKFADNTGHIFNLESYDYEPVDYEYIKNKYVFWINNNEHSYCSVNNYYIRPIYIITDYPCEYIKVSLSSSIFGLLDPNKIQMSYEENGAIEINHEDIVSELVYDIRDREDNVNIFEASENQDIMIVPISTSGDNSDSKYMYPFYVVALSDSIGSFTTNILISSITYTNEEAELTWDCCPITVGAEFNEENEILYINGLNMGIQLPREIIRAVYNASYVNETFDEVLYNEKLKEYLIEYMKIRGEIGNYNSAENSLKWFGWGKRINIASLLKTDNQFMIQYVRDYFSTESDILLSFSNFINSTMISLHINENIETGEYNDYDLSADFMGENQPLLEDLLNKKIPVTYGGLGEETYYYKNYYNFIFSELLFKIAALKYYYEKYFLPVHLSVLNASVHHKVYMNDTKMISKSTNHITESIVPLGIYGSDYVEFPKDNIQWLSEQIHFVDENFNEWNYSDIENDDRTIYYIYDTCVNIPIKFVNDIMSTNVHLILEKNTKSNDNLLYINKEIDLYELISDEHDIADSFKIIMPNELPLDLNNAMCSYSTNAGRTYSPFFKGINKLFDNLNNNFRIETQFSYDTDEEKFYISFIKENTEYKFYLGETETIVNVSNKKYIIPSVNDISIDLLNNMSASGYIYCVEKIRLRIKIGWDKINSISINGEDYIDDIKIRYTPTSEIIYESDFAFNNETEEYLNFVILPKMLNKAKTDIMTNAHGANRTDKEIDITYWIDGEFTLRLLVNNKWHRYDFTIKMPDINIEFGKLVYKYYDDEYKISSSFNQLSYLDETTFQFNAFMHEPKLARMNHINFLEDFIKYIKTTNARYINGNLLKNNEFYYYFDINYTNIINENKKQRIYVHNDSFGKDVIIPRAYFDYDTIFYLFLDKDLIYVIHDTFIDNVYEVVCLDDSALIFDQNGGKTIYNDPNNYKRFIYDPDRNVYVTYISSGEVSFVVQESLRSDFDSFRNQYIERHNIINNDKYLNQIHVYDLYRLNEHYGNNIISLKNNIDLLYHGIRFTHNSFINGNIIHISGNVNNLINNSSERTEDKKSFLSYLPEGTEQETDYSSYVNTFDDLVIYSAYANDFLSVEEELQPDGFIYYEQLDIDGNRTGRYTTTSTSPIRYNERVYLSINERTNPKEYIDANTINELISFISATNIYVHTQTDKNDFKLRRDADGRMYCERNNIDEDITYVVYKVDILYNDKVYNPTKYDFCNFIRPILFGQEPAANSIYDSTNIGIRAYFYIQKHILINNIQHIHTVIDDVTINEETGRYETFINGQRTTLTPFYKEYDGNTDRLFNVKSLVAQPGIDWINIHTLDDYEGEFNIDTDMDEDTIEYVDFDNIDNIISTDNDIKTLLEHRKILIMNVTSALNNAIKQYKTTSRYKDDIVNKQSFMRFAINSNTINATTDDVEVLTVTRVTINDGTEKIYKYFDKEFTICADIDENNDLFVDESIERELSDTQILYNSNNEYTVFFAIVNKRMESYDLEFSMDINPTIRLVYDDYDLSEYNELEYAGNDFVEYTINDTTYKYGDCRENENIIKLYNEFFDTDIDEYSDDFKIVSVNCRKELNIDNGNIKYDMYLMHNTKNWYIVYISKETCDKTLSLYDFIAHKKEFVFNGKYHTYKLILNTSVRKFLLNRYVYVSSNGNNHFKRNDIIVGNVLNNRLPVDIFKTSRWEMIPISIDLDKQIHTSKSNIDMCIFDVPKYNNEYARGYYQVKYKYSLDRISTQQYFKYGKICID